MLTVKSPGVYQVSPTKIDLEIFTRVRWWLKFSFVSEEIQVDFRASDLSLLEPLSRYLPSGWQTSTSYEDADLCYFLVNTVSKNGKDTLYQLYRGVQQIAEIASLEDIYDIFNSDLQVQLTIQKEDVC